MASLLPPELEFASLHKAAILLGPSCGVFDLALLNMPQISVSSSRACGLEGPFVWFVASC